MVVTDVSGRGLDIPQVQLVVNYDLPNSVDDYVYRLGRTGCAGREGYALSFFATSGASANTNVARGLFDVLFEAKVKIPQGLVEEVDKLHRLRDAERRRSQRTGASPARDRGA